MVKERKPFYTPSQPANTSSASPSDQANKDIKDQVRRNNALINFTEGKINNIENFYNGEKNLSSYYNMSNVNQNGYGRTINVPKVLPAGVVPGPSYNGAVTIGEKCVGPHCAIPVTPTSGNFVNKNLRSTNAPEQALRHYPSTYRLGNNSDIMPGLAKYTNDGLNSGPFNIDVPDNSSGLLEYIINPVTNRKVRVDSDIGKKVMENYLNFRN